ncbi:MAG: arginine deiminase-related protein [Flavobacterium sp.]
MSHCNMATKQARCSSYTLVVQRSPAQVEQLEKHAEILSSSLDTIEACGGGSARCMMAEVFLPRN